MSEEDNEDEQPLDDWDNKNIRSRDILKELKEDDKDKN